MKRALPYIFTVVIGGVIAVVVMCSMQIWDSSGTVETLQILCDSFFGAGALVFGAGLLVVCSNGGAFYMLSYGFIKLRDLFRRGAKGKYKDFYEYSESKKEKKRGFGYMLIVGLVFLVVAVAFLIAYNNV